MKTDLTSPFLYHVLDLRLIVSIETNHLLS